MLMFLNKKKERKKISFWHANYEHVDMSFCYFENWNRRLRTYLSSKIKVGSSLHAFIFNNTTTTYPKVSSRIQWVQTYFQFLFFFSFFRVRGLVRRRRPVSSLAIWIPIGTNLSFFSLMKWIWREFGLMLQ